jgi:aminopeptidase N
MSNDCDGFNRWDAAQRISQKILLSIVNDPQYAVPQGYVNAFAKVLTDTDSDKALLAEILSLPEESYLGDQMEVIDVDSIHNARESLKLHIALELKDNLLEVYQANSDQEQYDISSASIARRSLRNLSLDYLMQLDDAEINSICVEQYLAQNNMTDVIAALGLIAHSNIIEREELLLDFYSRWEHDQLVLDKWFTVQAVSKRSDALVKVRELMEHPTFNIRNPNRVRSLIGVFCSANQANFHALDGSGYALLGETVIQLDSINPQIAARMLRMLSRWRRYDEKRQIAMQQQLEHIVKGEGVSKDVYEVASKSLV